MSESNCSDGLDDDFDGDVDCDDFDGNQDSACAVNEICNNGIDDDNNGFADCNDPYCCLIRPFQ